jgi:hypothetical protein
VSSTSCLLYGKIEETHIFSCSYTNCWFLNNWSVEDSASLFWLMQVLLDLGVDTL